MTDQRARTDIVAANLIHPYIAAHSSPALHYQTNIPTTQGEQAKLREV